MSTKGKGEILFEGSLTFKHIYIYIQKTPKQFKWLEGSAFQS